MKCKNFKMLLLVGILVCTILTGCGTKNTEEVAEKKPVSITDMSGREITLEKPATKIVVLTASDCEILYALGAGDTIVARGEFCNYPEEVLDIKEVTSGNDTNIEQIIAEEPELVILNYMAQTDEQISAIENADIPVLVNDAASIDEVYTSIENIGKVVGKEDEAASLIDEMKNGFKEISEVAEKGGDKSVYFEVSPLQYGLWTSGKDTFMDELSTMLGVENTFSDVEGWAEISQEQVIERNPDYIITIYMGMDDQQSPTEEIMSREGWENIEAVKNGNVITIDSDEVSRPGPRLVDAAKSLKDIFYGE